MPETQRPRLHRVPEMAPLGRALKLLRGNRSQAEIAGRAGISRGYLSELEQGKRPHPRRRTLERLAAVLGTTVEALLPPAPAQPPASEPPPEEQAGGEGGDVPNATVLPPRGGGAAASTVRVYRWGTWGDPTDPERAPAPLAYEWVPRGSESVIEPDAICIVVRGDGLRGWRIRDGDQCVVNLRAPTATGRLVGARIISSGGEGGMGVYELAEGPPGPDGAPTAVLRAWPDCRRPVIVPARRFRVLGPVVQVWRQWSPDEGRPRRLDADDLERERYGAPERGGPAGPPAGPEGGERPPPPPERINIPGLDPSAPTVTFSSGVCRATSFLWGPLPPS